MRLVPEHESPLRQGFRGARIRSLERALFFTLACHLAAMLAMAVLLLPGMPGGGSADGVARAVYVATHPWLWRLGWLPWQITAASDLWVGVALVRWSGAPRAWSWAALVLTAIAVVPDQLAQAIWVTEGIELAERAAAAGDVAPYLALEARIFPLMAGWGGLFYTLGAIAWSFAFAGARTWSRALGGISIVAWSVFLGVSVAPIVPPALRPAPAIIAAGNALGFALFTAWLVLVTEHVLCVSRPFGAHGRSAPWRHPGSGLRARALEALANSRFLRAVCEPLPVPAFRSDITDVVYVNYLVPAGRLQRLVPEGLELQRLGPEGAFSLFTILTYRHGHFGPRLLGPLRRLLPSPVQSNWRIYVRDPASGKAGIHFVTTAIGLSANALGARCIAEGLPMHVPERASVERDADGTLRVVLVSGSGSAPDVDAALRPSTARDLPAPWSECFASYRDLLAYDVPQDRALSTQPWRRTVTRQEIDLGIPLDACEPLEGEVRSRAAEAIVGDARPLCFRVAKVGFLFAEERRSPMAPCPPER